jgi:enoyl-CoA hydratase
MGVSGMGSEHYVTEISGGVITVRFSRPAKLNAISPEMTQGLWEALRQLADSPDLHAMVITGTGRYFTAGIDLAAVPGDRRGDAHHSDIAFRRAYRQHHLLYDEFESVEKPIILAAQGPCLGAGVEMAASCDFRFASTESYFALPEINLGVIPGSGGASRVTRLVGPHWSKWLGMAGQRISAEQAMMIGFVHEVYEPSTFDERVAAFAHELAALPHEAVGAAKLVIDLAADIDRTSARHVERIANSPLNASPDFAKLTARYSK